jgi:hypothetical protein
MFSQNARSLRNDSTSALSAPRGSAETRKLSAMWNMPAPRDERTRSELTALAASARRLTTRERAWRPRATRRREAPNESSCRRADARAPNRERTMRDARSVALRDTSRVGACSVPPARTVENARRTARNSNKQILVLNGYVARTNFRRTPCNISAHIGSVSHMRNSLTVISPLGI